jgi:hypothetical protein
MVFGAVSEKLFHALSTLSVGLYRGGNGLHKFTPKGIRYIDAKSMGMDGVLSELHRLDQNPLWHVQYLEGWELGDFAQDFAGARTPFAQACSVKSYCRLCKWVAEREAEQPGWAGGSVSTNR